MSISNEDTGSLIDLKAWLSSLPEGAISIEVSERRWKFRASNQLQLQLELLLERKKAGQLTDEDSSIYEAICNLDSFLSDINRVVRGLTEHQLQSLMSLCDHSEGWLHPSIDGYDNYDANLRKLRSETGPTSP